MPLYEYECGTCHRRTEKIQKFSDPELTACPFCGGPLARTLTAPAIQFKGSGWYKDLYSSAKPPAGGNTAGESAPAAAAGAGEGASGNSGTTADSGNKPAAATAPASAPAPSTHTAAASSKP